MTMRPLSYSIFCGVVGIALLGLSFAPCARGASASWSLAPANYDFGAVQPGAAEPAAPAIFTLTNTGDVDLPPPRIAFEYQVADGREPAPFDLSPTDCESGVSFGAGKSCNVEVTFRPHNPGQLSGRVTLSDPSGQVPSATASFEGVGNGPIVSFTPPLLSLGSSLVGDGESLPAVLTMANVGNADLAISSMSLEGLGANPNQVSIVGGTCKAGTSVVASGSCTIQVAFTPTQEEEFRAEVRIVDNAAHGFQEVEVRGWAATNGPLPPSRRTVFIKGRPQATTKSRTATFRFGVSQGNAPFACRLDRGRFLPCRSPKTYRHLALGMHEFRVKPRIHAPGLWAGAAVARFRVVPRHPSSSA